jgi:hypothetical protein
MGFLDDLERPELHAADQSQAEVPYEELSDLLARQIKARKIEPEALCGKSTTVGELNFSVEMGPILGHSRGV